MAWEKLTTFFGFDTTMSQALSEVQAGRLIEMRPRAADRKRIVLPYSIFNQCIEVLYEESPSRVDEKAQ